MGIAEPVCALGGALEGVGWVVEQSLADGRYHGRDSGAVGFGSSGQCVEFGACDAGGGYERPGGFPWARFGAAHRWAWGDSGAERFAVDHLWADSWTQPCDGCVGDLGFAQRGSGAT